MVKSQDTTAEGVVLNDVISMGWGLLYTPLCASKHLSMEEAAAKFTAANPPGTMNNEWVPADPERLPEDYWGGKTEHVYPKPCNEFPETRYHFVVNC